jgi:hypothetical protein
MKTGKIYVQKQSNVNPGFFYYYMFANKQELQLELLNRIDRKLSIENTCREAHDDWQQTTYEEYQKYCTLMRKRKVEGYENTGRKKK